MPPDESLDKVGPIVLKDNCYIGAYSVLMPNTSVGRNSIVAAGSIVTKHIPDNEVWGGVPAKFIMTVDEYAEKLLGTNKHYTWLTDRHLNVGVESPEMIAKRIEFFFGDK